MAPLGLRYQITAIVSIEHDVFASFWSQFGAIAESASHGWNGSTRNRRAPCLWPEQADEKGNGP